MSSTNGTGIEFHVEDSAGLHGPQTGFLTESLTVGGLSNNFDLPYTVNFGFAADTFQIPAFDIDVCIKNGTGGNCNSNHNNGTDYWIISPGTSLLTGGTSNGDDDWAFETNLVGCVNTSDSGPGSCGTIVAPFVSFLAGDPPPVPAVPEPSTSAVFFFGLAALATLRVWRRSL
jgi:hypothetical protein